MTWIPPILTAVVVLLVLVGAFGSLFVLQKRFLSACDAKDNLELYGRMPFGVPEGSVRAVLAIAIVFASIAYIALAMVSGSNVKFPEVMAGILGTVLGFYFGSRSGGGAAAAEAVQQVGTANAQRDRAVAESNQTKLSALMDKARAGVEVARTLSKILPAEVGGRMGRITESVAKGLDAADHLASAGQTVGAVVEAGKALDALKKDSPIADVLSRASSSFGQVLGTAVPPLAVAGVVVTVGAKLAGAAYDRWVARVLDAPYTPELFPATIFDAAVGGSLLRQSPIFRRVFADEMQRGDLAFVRQLTHDVLSEDADERLWRNEEVSSRFADRAELARGIGEFQRAAMTEEVRKDIDPGLVAEVGGVDGFLASVDKLNANEEAQRDLDAIVLMADQLKRDGKAVAPLFDEAMAEVTAGNPEGRG